MVSGALEAENLAIDRFVKDYVDLYLNYGVRMCSLYLNNFLAFALK